MASLLLLDTLLSHRLGARKYLSLERRARIDPYSQRDTHPIRRRALHQFYRPDQTRARLARRSEQQVKHDGHAGLLAPTCGVRNGLRSIGPP